MKRSGVFVAGVLSGAVALGLLLLGWSRLVMVAPTPPPVVVVAPDSVAVAPPASAAEAPAPVELPLPEVPRGGSEPSPLPRPAVVVVPPSQPVPGVLPLDAEATPVAAGAPLPPADGPALSLIIPVEGITAAQLSDTFTDARGEGRLHDAIDIMAPTGTPVRAVADGRIVKLFNSKAGGLTLYQFDAAETVSFYYAHLDRYADGVAEGQLVKQGDLVGYVGFTGNASPDGPHLHFAVTLLGADKKWWQGTAINPYPYLHVSASR
jgi:murein DD-endopeptidase MepM/ murein hydrolase activator NlpD